VAAAAKSAFAPTSSSPIAAAAGTRPGGMRTELRGQALTGETMLIVPVTSAR